MFRLRQEPTQLICYRSGPNGDLTKGSHVGTKRAAIERAVGTALKNQYYHAGFLRSVVNLSSGREKDRLFSKAIAWTTTLIECRLTLEKVATCNDPGDEGSDWGIRALCEENDRRAAFLRNRLSRALSGTGQNDTTEYVHLLKYMNLAEDYGSDS